MKSMEWKTYRTRFLIKAKQLNSNLTFVDALGRQHSGRKGDYLVESSEGVVSIAPRRIFEDIYVPIVADQRRRPTRAMENAPEMRKSAVSHGERSAGSSFGLLS